MYWFLWAKSFSNEKNDSTKIFLQIKKVSAPLVIKYSSCMYFFRFKHEVKSKLASKQTKIAANRW